MHLVCRTCSAVQDVGSALARGAAGIDSEHDRQCDNCGAVLAISDEPAPRRRHLPEDVWFTVRGEGPQAGPFGAEELARRLDGGEFAWTDFVWRKGLRDWRPARRDDALIVAIANVRGLDKVTMRLDALPQLLAAAARAAAEVEAEREAEEKAEREAQAKAERETQAAEPEGQPASAGSASAASEENDEIVGLVPELGPALDASFARDANPALHALPVQEERHALGAALSELRAALSEPAAASREHDACLEPAAEPPGHGASLAPVAASSEHGASLAPVAALSAHEASLELVAAPPRHGASFAPLAALPGYNADPASETRLADEVDPACEASPEDEADDTLVDVIPAGLASSWPTFPDGSRPSFRRSRTAGSLARGLRMMTMALSAFVVGAVLVGLSGRLAYFAEPQPVAAQKGPPPAAPSAVATLPSAASQSVRPASGERVKRTLPALEELRSELRRLGASARRCVRDPRQGVELDLVIAGDTGRPRQIEVRTPRLTPGAIECTKAAVAELSVAPFTAPELAYRHRYAW